jgi:nitrile hydratase beta subunit
MNGVHDMGGMQCFGPVVQEADEPLFHHPWERQAFALTLALGAGGLWNIDASRFTRESLPPALYLEGGYYRIWLEALERLIQQGGLLSARELSTAHLDPSHEAPERFRRLEQGTVAALFAKGWPSTREVTQPAAFQVGQRVRTVNRHPAGHTRLPRYARGRIGTVAAIRGVHVYPDSNAEFAGESPDWLYSIRFEATELWGPDTTADCVHLDCWQAYLQVHSNEAVCAG